MKSFTDIFIKHPVLAIVINLAILLIGLNAAFSLPVQQFPSIEKSSIIATTVYVGASAETVQGYITVPLERALSSVNGVDYVQSQSFAGLSTITMQLRLNYDSYAALSEVNAKLQEVRSDLPSDAEPPNVILQRADRPYATFYVSFTSDKLNVTQLTDFVTRQVQPEFASIKGVQRCGVEGGLNMAMRVWLDSAKLDALALTPGEVTNALRRNNFLAAIGQTKNNLVQVDLLTNTDLRNTEEFENLIVRDDGGSIVRLRDVARVELGSEEGRVVTMVDDKEGVFLSVWPAPGTNEIEIAELLKARMEEVRTTLPNDVQMKLAWDGTKFMSNALTDITKTLAETILIVGIIVFLFMGSIRSAIVPLVAMPVSLVGAVALMALLGFSLNLLTILAIVLAVGLVVDDAIVVVENVERHIREGRSRISAALIGARELTGPVIAMTITLAAVYTPIGFQVGLTGVLFREFAFTLAAAVVVSGIVALTLSPIMSANMISRHGKESAFARMVNRHFDRLRVVYSRVLSQAMIVRWPIFAGAILLGLVAVPLYMFSGKELAPTEDQGFVAFFVEGSPDASLAYAKAQSEKLSRNLLDTIPEGKQTFQIVNSSFGFGGLLLDDWNARDKSAMDLQQEVMGVASQQTGINAFALLLPSLPSAGQSDVELVITTPDSVTTLQKPLDELRRRCMEKGIFMFTQDDLKIDLPLTRVSVNREKVADLGLDLAGVGQQLGTLLGGADLNRFNHFDRSYPVIPQLEAGSRTSASQLLDLKIRGRDGTLIPIASLIDLNTTAVVRSLNRFQQKNSITFSGGIIPVYTKESALTEVEKIAKEVMPGNSSIDYAGESRQIRIEGDKLVSSLGFAMIMIYLVLAAQFRSFRDPLIVLLGSVPLALTGGLAFSFLDFTTINIYSQVGLITLVGLVAKNGILIVEFANHLQAEGRSRIDAVVEAAGTRFRPILMTSAATVFGHLPLVFVTGPGAAARNSIGIILVSGMVIGTLFTLFVVPAIYSIIASNKSAVSDEEEDESHESLIPSVTPSRQIVTAS